MMYSRLWENRTEVPSFIYATCSCLLTSTSSTIIQHLTQECSTRPKDAVAYFYFDFNTAAKQEVSKCISSLVGQLCAQIGIIPSQIIKAYDRCNKGNSQPSLSDLIEMLIHVIEDFDNVFIVIDALDECPKDGERDQLLAAISDIKAISASNLHILVTSRREPDIEDAVLPLVSVPVIPLQGSYVNMDIQMHIAHQLATDPKLKKWSIEIKEEIESTLTKGANGMYVFAAPSTFHLPPIRPHPAREF